MDWITVVWSAGMGICLVLALMHLLVWFQDRHSWSSVCFTVIALGIIGLGACEVALMRAGSPEEFVRIVRLGHLLFGPTVAASLIFIHLDFGTGRAWLLFVSLGLRAAAVAVNQVGEGSLHFVSVESLESIRFLGESITIAGEVSENPWVRLGQLAALAQIAYVTDASVRLWRRSGSGDRQRALWIGGSTVLLFLCASILTGVVSAGLLRAPILVSFPFMGMVLAISYDMSKNLIRTARLAKELEANQRRLALAGAAGRLAFWEWDIERDRIWLSGNGWSVFGIKPVGNLTFGHFIEHVHDEDRPQLVSTMREFVRESGTFAAEFRLVAPEGGRPRWLSALGQVEKNRIGDPVLFRGFSIDVSRRKEAEAEVAQQRRELSHLSRVATLGALSGALAHELNQPLTAILSNGQVALRHLGSQPPKLAEMDEILGDIVEDAKRAGGIIHGMRAMFTKDSPVELQPVDLNAVVTDSLKLLHGEIMARGTAVEFDPRPSLPPVMASRVELQQVVINLILNSLEALATRGPADPVEPPRVRIRLFATAGGICLEVADNGPGIPAANLASVFEPFFSTKSGANGLGLGLSISRGIVERCGGKLEAVPPQDGRGTVFRITLPASAGGRQALTCENLRGETKLSPFPHG